MKSRTNYHSDDATILKKNMKDNGEEEEEATSITSPTSVVVMNVISTSTTSIVMGEEGAEVALHDLTNIPPPTLVTTPDTSKNNSDCFVRGGMTGRTSCSLLDVEKTPVRTPTNPRPSVINTTPSTCGGCGSSNNVFCDDLDGGHAYLERTITTFLEDTSTVPSTFSTSCTDWQAWSYFGFFDHQQQQDDDDDDLPNSSPSKESIRSVLRHRASQSLRTRKTTLRNLRKNLVPFANSPIRSPARAPSLFRNRSFSVSDHKAAIVRVSKDKQIGPMKTSFTNVLQLCTMPENTTLDSPEFVKKLKPRDGGCGGGGYDGDVCYDSDPEDFTRRRRTPINKGSFNDDSNMANHHHDTRTEYPGISYSPSRALIDVNNDDIFQTIVQEVFNQTTTLVLHPLSSSESGPQQRKQSQSPRPVAIDAWLERGQNLAYRLIQPKWMWKQKHMQDASPKCIELLDITRILKVEDSDNVGSSQPFAKQSHCFIIKSIHNDEFCFEAPNSMERDRLVYALKLVIARFGAKILVGDPQVYWEFFTMAEATIPGEAPDVLGGVYDDAEDYDDYEEEEEEEDDIDL